MRSLLIRLCLVAVYVLVAFEVGMVLGSCRVPIGRLHRSCGLCNGLRRWLPLSLIWRLLACLQAYGAAKGANE